MVAEWDMKAIPDAPAQLPSSQKVHTSLNAAPKWTILMLGNSGNADSKLKPSQTLIEGLSRYGVAIQSPLHDPQNVNSKDEDFDKDLGAKFAWFKKEKLALVFVVLPSNKAITYERVKYWGDYKHGISRISLLVERLGSLTVRLRDSYDLYQVHQPGATWEDHDYIDKDDEEMEFRAESQPALLCRHRSQVQYQGRGD